MSVREVPPPRAPQQERSRRSHAKVLSVARDLVAKYGHDGVAIADVARLADVAVGTIYNRFGDKTGLLRAVSGHESGEVQHHILAAIQAARHLDDTRLRLETAVRGIVGAFREHAYVMQQLFFLAATDAAIREQGSVLTKPMAAAFTQLLSGVDAPPGPLARRADLCFRIVFSACVFRTTYGEDSESDLPLPWNEFEDELVQAAMAYVIDCPGGLLPSAAAGCGRPAVAPKKANGRKPQ